MGLFLRTRWQVSKDWVNAAIGAGVVSRANPQNAKETNWAEIKTRIKWKQETLHRLFYSTEVGGVLGEFNAELRQGGFVVTEPVFGYYSEYSLEPPAILKSIEDFDSDCHWTDESGGFWYYGSPILGYTHNDSITGQYEVLVLGEYACGWGVYAKGQNEDKLIAFIRAYPDMPYQAKIYLRIDYPFSQSEDKISIYGEGEGVSENDVQYMRYAMSRAIKNHYASS